MRSRISTRLLAWFLLVSLLPMMTIGYLAYRFAASELREAIKGTLVATADARARQIDSFFLERQRDVSVLALDPTVAGALDGLRRAFEENGVDSPEYALADSVFREFLAHLAQTFGYYDLMLIAPDGTVVFSVQHEADFGSNLVTGPYRETQAARVFKNACTLLETEISDFEVYAPSAEPAAFLAAPVLRHGQLRGVVALQLSTSEINELAAEHVGLGRTGETLLAAQLHGDAVFVTPTRHDWKAAFVRTAATSSESEHPLQLALSGKRGSGIYTDYRGQQVLAAWRYLPQMRWAMAVKMDVQEAFAPVRALSRWALLFGLLTVVLVGGIALSVARSFSRPIRLLARKAGQVATGDLAVRVDIDRDDELGELARTFNGMVASLRKSIEDARLKVEYLDQVPTAVLSVDRDLTILFANNAAAELCGRSKEACVGSKCYELFNTTHCHSGDCGMQRAWRDDRVLTADTDAELPGGKTPIRYTCGVLRDEKGSSIGGIEVLADISSEAEIVRLAGEVSRGNLGVEFTPRTHDDKLALALRNMTTSLREARRERERRLRHTGGLSALKDALRGGEGAEGVADRALRFLCNHLGAHVGAFYIRQDDAVVLASSFAFEPGEQCPERFEIGQGLVGQVALENRELLLPDVSPERLRVSSGLVNAVAEAVLLFPFQFQGWTMGVVELGFFEQPNEEQLAFLRAAGESVGIAIQAALSRAGLEDLLRRTENQAQDLETANLQLQSQREELESTNEELQVQQEELRQANEELEEKAEEMRLQGEELRQANEELEEKAGALQERQQAIKEKNRRIEEDRLELEARTEQLALSSRYKSEFLANMSHELRTPLNSLLILSSLLGDNAEGNLTAKQVEYADTIRSSGQDLLTLINEILDLAKIESGTMAVQAGQVIFADLAQELGRNFAQVAQLAGLAFSVQLDEALPACIHTDGQRLQQVLRNLLSNAFKFTERGSVALDIAPAEQDWTAEHPLLGTAETVIAFAVTDTGIGIQQSKQQVIFEAFQQADGSSSRRYGGTGLGLSISREIANLLGGDLGLRSEPGQGSRFTLYLPGRYQEPEPPAAEAPAKPVASRLERAPQAEVEAPGIPDGDEELPVFIQDDRDRLQPGERTVLLIEDDPVFARALGEVAHEHGFRCLAAGDGEHGLAMAARFLPDAIALDIALPGIDGWTVLDRLKTDPRTRPIPVHVISAAVDEQRAIYGGAIAALQKPVGRERLDRAFEKLGAFIDRPHRQLLLVEDDANERQAIADLLTADDVTITAVRTGTEALRAMESLKFDCMVLDLGLPGMNGFEVLQRMRGKGITDLPVVVYTGRELTRREALELGRLTRAVVVKDVRSPERLLQETALFLHRVHQELPDSRKKTSRQRSPADPGLAGKRLLLVDDDLRNIFALTSVLEAQGAEALFAEDGLAGLELLQRDEEIDAVLMDIMMPEMDGYEAMRRIRAIPRLADLPVIALTAKAMKGDRRRCLDAGASDYIAKPVDVEQLLSLLRVWLYER